MAALGVAFLEPEGLTTAALRATGLTVGRIEDALDLQLHRPRLVATLRRRHVSKNAHVRPTRFRSAS